MRIKPKSRKTYLDETPIGGVTVSPLRTPLWEGPRVREDVRQKVKEDSDKVIERNSYSREVITASRLQSRHKDQQKVKDLRGNMVSTWRQRTESSPYATNQYKRGEEILQKQKEYEDKQLEKLRKQTIINNMNGIPKGDIFNTLLMKQVQDPEVKMALKYRQLDRTRGELVSEVATLSSFLNEECETVEKEFPNLMNTSLSPQSHSSSIFSEK